MSSHRYFTNKTPLNRILLYKHLKLVQHACRVHTCRQMNCYTITHRRFNKINRKFTWNLIINHKIHMEQTTLHEATSNRTCLSCHRQKHSVVEESQTRWSLPTHTAGLSPSALLQIVYLCQKNTHKTISSVYKVRLFTCKPEIHNYNKPTASIYA